MASNRTPPNWEPLNPRPHSDPLHSSPPRYEPIWRVPDSPPPTPGFQAHAEQRFQLARTLLKRHTRLGASRSQTALLLALADLFLAFLAVGLYFLVVVSFPATSWLLRGLLLFCVLVAFFCLLAALLLALRAALWCRGVGLPPVPFRYLFQSGAAAPLPDLEHFDRDLRRATHDSLLTALIAELHACARLRQCQETRIRRAVIATLTALVFFGLAVILSAVLV